MTQQQSTHAHNVVGRFKEMMDDAGVAVGDEHYEELALLIESALDAVIVEQLEKMAVKLDAMAHGLRHDELFFEDD